MNFKDKIVIVTGAGGGIGSEVARGFALYGAKVVLCDLDESKVRMQSDTISGDGGNALFFKMNVSKRSEVEEVMRKVNIQWGAPDVLVNAAGIITRNLFLDDTDEDWDRVMGVNLKGTWICSQAAARLMIESKKAGAIVNFGSVTSELADDCQVIYATSKGGIRSLTKAIAIALASYGIRVNAVGPATISTDLNRQYMADHPEELQKRLRRIPLGRLGKPADVVGGVLYLASDLAEFVTGTTLFIDGGRLSQNNV